MVRGKTWQRYGRQSKTQKADVVGIGQGHGGADAPPRQNCVDLGPTVRGPQLLEVRLALDVADRVLPVRLMPPVSDSVE